MPTPVDAHSLHLSRMHVVKTHPSDLPGWDLINIWDFEYPYPGKNTGRFVLVHRDKPRNDWTEEFYFCIDDLAIDLETIEQLSELVQEYLGFAMYPARKSLSDGE